jgi:LmbE family N-acetylglucosaminyl deacetylase
MAGLDGKRRVAVIVAHPDDEVLGCGGTIRRHATAGDEVSVIILADGETSRTPDAGAATIAKRETAAGAAAEVLGVHRLTLHRLSDNRLDTAPLLDVIQLIERDIGEIVPDIVYTITLATSTSTTAACTKR